MFKKLLTAWVIAAVAGCFTVIVSNSGFAAIGITFGIFLITFALLIRGEI